MADINIDGVVTWLKNWFYDKTEITGFLNNKANQSDLQTTNSNLSSLSSTVDNKVDKVTGKGLSTEDFTTALKDKLDGIEAQANKTVVDSALSSTSTNPLQNKAINTALSGKASTNHTHYIQNSSSDNGSLYIYPNGDGQNPAHLGAWLHALEAEVDNLTSFDLVEIVTTLPTAASETMNKLYLVAKSGGSSQDYYDIYITVQHENNGNYTYTWEKVDDFDLQNLSIDWDNVTNKPSSFTPASHTHGQVTNDGKITSTAVAVASGDNIVITDASDSSILKRVANLLASHIKDSTAHTNIGSSANDTQATINTDIDTALGNKITKTSTDNGFLKSNGDIDSDISAYLIKDPNAHTNIDSLANITQASINLKIDTALGTKGEISDDVDWSYNSNGFTNGVKLVDKTTNANGRITLHLKS